MLSSRRASLLTTLAASLCLPSFAQQPAQPTPATTQTQPSKAQPTTPPLPAQSSTPPAQTTTPLQAEAEQALNFILKHVILDPNAKVPGTDKPLSNRGIWAVGKQRPAACPKDTSPCVAIIYRVPEDHVGCEWVVLLNGLDGTVLEQNSDSVHYMLRNIPTAEAKPYVLSRQPSIVGHEAPRIQGTVEVGVIVSTTGDPTQIFPLSGPDQLRPIALAMSKQWTFRPLTAGSRTVPYQVILKFHFGGPEVKTEP